MADVLSEDTNIETVVSSIGDLVATLAELETLIVLGRQLLADAAEAFEIMDWRAEDINLSAVGALSQAISGKTKVLDVTTTIPASTVLPTTVEEAEGYTNWA